MADEIEITTRMKAKKGFLLIDENPGTLKFSMSGTRPGGNTQAIGFSAHEALSSVADIGTAGFAFFRNNDATNFVQLGLDVSATFYPFAKLLPGETAIVPLATTAIYAKADTASVDLYWRILPR